MAVSKLEKNYITRTFEKAFAVTTTGWTAYPISEASISGYTPVGIINSVIRRNSVFVTSAYAYIVGGQVGAHINANTANVTVDMDVKVLYERTN